MFFDAFFKKCYKTKQRSNFEIFVSFSVVVKEEFWINTDKVFL
jgi:hypothetical protein